MVVSYYLIDARARYRSLYAISHTRGLRYPLTVIRIARNASGQLVKRAIQRQSAERERDGEKEQKGRKDMDGAKFPSPLLYRARSSLARSLTRRRAAASCRSANRARNEFLMIVLFFLVVFVLFFCVFFSHFFLIPRDDGIYRALTPRTSRRARSVVNNEWAFYCRRPSRVYFLRFHRTFP